MIGETAVRPNGSAVPGAMPPRPVRSARRRRRAILAGVFILVIAAAAAAWLVAKRTAAAPDYTTAAAARGDFAQTVTASGTVTAQDTIAVGTQVSGSLQEIYVDFNSRVRRGQVLAKIDPSEFQAQLNQSRAALAQSRAQADAARQSVSGANFNVRAASAVVSSALAAVEKARAELSLAQETVRRDRALLTHGYIAQSQYDADNASAVSAAAALRSAQAVVEQNTAQGLQSVSGATQSASTAQAAGAAVQAAQANVAQDEVNLQRSVIRSPVDGTVVARNVSVGQTVAASFQTPTLFTIARDLKKMEVDIAVGEPDIGNVQAGDPVAFTVLAYPNRTFRGIVSQVRVNPTTVSNVVTYTVIVHVNNNDNKLLPGMTANATITVAQMKNALVVPLQALAYRPVQARQARVQRRQTPSPSSPWGAASASGAIVAGDKGVVFVLREGKARAVPVRVELVNGMQAAVTPLHGRIASGEGLIVSDGSMRSQRPAAVNNPTAGLGRMIR